MNKKLKLNLFCFASLLLPLAFGIMGGLTYRRILVCNVEVLDYQTNVTCFNIYADHECQEICNAKECVGYCGKKQLGNCSMLSYKLKNDNCELHFERYYMNNEVPQKILNSKTMACYKNVVECFEEYEKNILSIFFIIVSVLITIIIIPLWCCLLFHKHSSLRLRSLNLITTIF